jgi:hypothetical protein
MEEHFKTLRTLWETPCGKAFSQATELRMYARELALGFSYTWVPREKGSEWDELVRQSKKLNSENITSDGGRRILSAVKRNNENVPNAIGEKILSTLRSLTGKDTNADTKPIPSILEKAPGGVTPLTQKLLIKGPSVGERTILNDSRASSERANMVLVTNSTNNFLQNKGASAQSAADSGDVEGFASTTIMRRDESEESFASFAMSPSGLSGTIPLGLSEPLRIFLETNRPPREWLDARRDWNSFVRNQISQSKRYDTMLQVANACRAGLLDSETLDAWKEIESSYEPATRPIFYDTIALETCLTWLKKNVGIVWVEHQAFGAALSQLSGAPYFGPGGLDASGASIANEKADRSVIASVAACGQGFNLQMFSKNLITSCPSGAATIEQVLGRTHRDGQLADEVTVDVLLGCLEQFEAFERALDGATAAEALLGHSQKLLLADILMPDIDNRKGPLWV